MTEPARKVFPFVCLVYFVVGHVFWSAREQKKLRFTSNVEKNAKDSPRCEFVLLQKNIKVFLPI